MHGNWDFGNLGLLDICFISILKLLLKGSRLTLNLPYACTLNNLQIIKQLHDENPFFLIQVLRYSVS